MSRGTIRFLGTGASTGVPVINCTCKVCSSLDPKNKRLRSGMLLSYEGKSFLIDAGPDFREQALAYKIGTPAALFLTHTHYDHVGGLEEMRAYSYQTHIPVPCYLSRSSFENIQKMYYYLFLPKSERTSSRTALFDFHVLEGTEGVISLQEKAVNYFLYTHGDASVLGFKFGSFAYVTDIKEYTPELVAALEDIDLLVMSATCLKHSHVHMTIDEAIAFSQLVRAKKTYFVHLAHEIDYAYVSSLLPANISLAYDGLELQFNW